MLDHTDERTLLVMQWTLKSRVSDIIDKARITEGPAWVPEMMAFAKLAMAHQREIDAARCLERHANGNFKCDTREDCARAISEG